ncbi:MAG: hypothetical protein ACKOF9_01540 [Burkholderiales bacterium]
MRFASCCRHLIASTLCAWGLVCHAQTTVPNPADPRPVASASAASAPSPARPSGKIYQQRQKDGSILFTDKPAESGSVTERSWSVPAEDPEQAEKRREKARQEAKQDAQAVDERVQRHIERERDREQALALERMRLNRAQAQRDAEIARAERERSERTAQPVVVVVPGQPRYQYRPPVVGSPPPSGQPVVTPPPRPSASLCAARKASDCNPSTEPGRSGFGGR